jgi:hypothetical protein
MEGPIKPGAEAAMELLRLVSVRGIPQGGEAL